jgi:HEPN domain-containing protein
MRDPDRVNTVVAEWMLKAENDLTNAAHTLKLREDCPTDTVCFHAQQCVEKYLKALLVLLDINFTKTHVIQALVGLLPPGTAVELSLEEQRRLTAYAVAVRHPESPIPSLVEARKALALARRVRRDGRRLLPRAALRRRKKERRD